MSTETTIYAEMGGSKFFTTLVHHFYAGVGSDPLLRPMYPDDDLAPAEHRLLMFLEQYWGGPTTYSQERGHPRLRLRHAPYVIDDEARDHWIGHMRHALDAAMTEHDLDPALEQQLWHYLMGAAYAMVNAEPPQAAPRPGMTIHENPS
jgi:hemoglobin